MVYFLARQFISKGHHLSIIDEDGGEVLAMSKKLKAVMLCGDGTDPDVLEEAGARRADAVLALTQNDQDNLAACQIASKLHGVPRTIALVNDPENEAVFKKLGVSVAFSSAHILAQLLEQRAGFEEIVQLLPVAEGKVTAAEIALRPESPAVGRAVMELEFPEGALLVCLIRDGGVIVPRGDTLLSSGDRAVVVSIPENYGRVLRALTGENL